MKICYCNKCGKELDFWDIQEGYTIDTFLGYGSKHDTHHLNLHLCCDCMDELIDSCVLCPLDDPDLDDTIRWVS